MLEIESDRIPYSDHAFMGIDPSLQSTGISVIHQSRVRAWIEAPPAACSRGVSRLAYYRRAFAGIMQRHTPARITIEGYSFGSRSRMHSTGELGGVARLAAWDHGQTFLLVPPMTLKVLVAQDGKATKSAITLELFKRWAVEITDDDLADATGLGLFSLYSHMIEVREGLTKKQIGALAKAEIVVPGARVRSRR